MSELSLSSAVGGDEDVEQYRRQARKWLAENMRLRTDTLAEERDDEVRERTLKQLQAKLFAGGYSGICYPREYGGQGLSSLYQKIFNEESRPYGMPLEYNIPTLTIIAPTLLEFGSHEQKLRYLPAILRGEHLWVQFLSEPSGGSDLAGLITSAEPDGEGWALNGSKIWSTGAQRTDYALCLARTDWDKPKHEGLTMFIVPVRHPRVTVRRIKMVDGTMEFCQEYFDDVPLEKDAVLGEVNGGWAVASKLLGYERDAVGGGSPYSQGVSTRRPGRSLDSLAELARQVGLEHHEPTRQLVAEAWVNNTVQKQLADRLSASVKAGNLPPAAGTLLRLYHGLSQMRRSDIALEIAGGDGCVWDEPTTVSTEVEAYLMRQIPCLGGGTTEIARNIIAERLLAMPREYAADRGLPFREVRRNGRGRS
jgi:alkylation response protein AidB-like acyl-CoA dehydrogenase